MPVPGQRIQGFKERWIRNNRGQDWRFQRNTNKNNPRQKNLGFWRNSSVKNPSRFQINPGQQIKSFEEVQINK